jgi:hypothetical protein
LGCCSTAKDICLTTIRFVCAARESGARPAMLTEWLKSAKRPQRGEVR